MVTVKPGGTRNDHRRRVAGQGPGASPPVLPLRLGVILERAGGLLHLLANAGHLLGPGGITGGQGADVFVLGDSRGIFYDDRTTGNIGNNDYAWIRDFQAGIDRLQLRAGFAYVASYGINGSTSLYWDRNANGIVNTGGSNRDELISVIDNARITSADILWA